MDRLEGSWSRTFAWIQTIETIWLGPENAQSKSALRRSGRASTVNAHKKPDIEKFNYIETNDFCAKSFCTCLLCVCADAAHRFLLLFIAIEKRLSRFDQTRLTFVFWNGWKTNLSDEIRPALLLRYHQLCSQVSKNWSISQTTASIVNSEWYPVQAATERLKIRFPTLFTAKIMKKKNSTIRQNLAKRV